MTYTSSDSHKRGLLAVIVTAAMFGATFGLTLPLITLVLESWGTSKTLIGLNAAMPGLAAVVCVPFYPSIIARIGLLAFIYWCIALVVISLLLFSVFSTLPAWFVIRFFNGSAAIGLFMASELWVNKLARNESRGRVVAIFTTAVSLGFIIGPIILSLVGTDGPLPFIIPASLIAATGLCLVFARSAVPPPDERTGIRITSLLTIAPLIACAALLDGILFMGIQALLPTYSLAIGLSATVATLTVAWFAVGMLVLPILVGMLVDRYNSVTVLIGTTLTLTVTVWMIPLGFAGTWSRALILVLLGGLVNGVYAVTLTMLGERFRGGLLAAATAGATIFFSLGELIGPTVVGASMDIVPAGYYISLGVLCASFMLVIIGLAQREVLAA